MSFANFGIEKVATPLETKQFNFFNILITYEKALITYSMDDGAGNFTEVYRYIGINQVKITINDVCELDSDVQILLFFNLLQLFIQNKLDKYQYFFKSRDDKKIIIKREDDKLLLINKYQNKSVVLHKTQANILYNVVNKVLMKSDMF